jgi:ubiquinone/menaquinone biosynthesis C-methylase UbiE
LRLPPLGSNGLFTIGHRPMTIDELCTNKQTMETPAQSFSEFAAVYDDFMHYIDYSGWVNYICDILDIYKIRGKKLLDLACGTGKCSVLFAKRGFDVTGIDLSQNMLAQALNKTETKILGIKFLCRDMRNFKIDNKVNAAICIYDSLNYLSNKNDLGCTFSNVYEALREGGAFIFDMNTEYALRKVWGTQTMHRNEGGVKSVWKSTYDRKNHTGTLHLTWTTKEKGKKIKHYEIHREISYSNDDIENLLKKAGFREVIIYAHNTFQPPIEVTSRIMVVALK